MSVDIPLPQNDITAIAQARAADGSLVEVGTVVSVRVKDGHDTALVRRLFSKSSASATTTYAHVHWTTTSYAGHPGELFLRAHQSSNASGPCTNVKVATIRCTIDANIRFAVDHHSAIWRDPLPPGRHRPVDASSDPFEETCCDSCLSLEAERGRAPRVIVGTGGQRAGFTKDGATYHVGDLIFFAPAAILTGEAWTPGILARSSRQAQQGEEVEWGVRVCGRFGDLPDAGERFIDEVSSRALPSDRWRIILRGGPSRCVHCAWTEDGS